MNPENNRRIVLAASALVLILFSIGVVLGFLHLLSIFQGQPPGGEGEEGGNLTVVGGGDGQAGEGGGENMTPPLELPCFGLGNPCENSGACCSGYCDSAGYTCALRPQGEPCGLDSECESGMCSNGVCYSCALNASYCGLDSECCGGLCLNNMCAACIPSLENRTCSLDSECCSGHCDETTGLCVSCLSTGAACSQDNECCSGTCSAGICELGLQNVTNATQNMTMNETWNATANMTLNESGNFSNVSSNATPMPDLSAEPLGSGYLLPKQVGVPAAVGIRTRNLGNVSSNPSRTAVMFAGVNVANISVPGLANFASMIRTVNITCPAAGLNELRVIADAISEVNESDENNNVWSGLILCGGLPDLAPGAAVSQLSGAHPLGEEFAVEVSAANLAQYVASPSSVMRVVFAGSAVANLTFYTIYPNSSQSQNVTLVCPAVGAFDFQLIADANSQVNETDEANNQWGYPVQCMNSSYSLSIAASNLAPDVLDPVSFSYSLSPGVPEGYLTFYWNLGPFKCYDGVLAGGGLTNGSGLNATASPTIRYLCPAIPAYGNERKVNLTVGIAVPGQPQRTVTSDTLTVPVGFCSRAGCPYESYDDVLLVVNDQSPRSVAIGNYYSQQRGVSHIVHLGSITPNYEAVRYQDFADYEYEQNLRGPIVQYLEQNNLADRINYIVLTKDIPFIYAVTIPGTEVRYDYSIDSRLMTALGPCEQGSHCNTMSPYLHSQYSEMPVFTRTKYGVYLVSRLMGYDEAGSRALVDRAYGNRGSGIFVLDKGVWPGVFELSDELNVRMDTAMQRLQAMGVESSRFVADAAGDTYITGQQDVLMYVSWGYNDLQSRVPLERWHGSYGRPASTWANGAVGETYVSYGGRTFNGCPSYSVPECPSCSPKYYVTYAAGAEGVMPAGTVLDSGECGSQLQSDTQMPAGTRFYNFTRPNQGLVADLVAEGAAGVKGYVNEPGMGAMARVDLLFPRYYQGYNLGDSFYSSSQRTYWMDVYVGDPKGRLRG